MMMRKAVRTFVRPAVATFTRKAHTGAKWTTNTNTARGVLFIGAGLGALGFTFSVSECSFFSSKPTVDYAKIKKAIADAIEADDEKRENGTSIGPTLIRLAWHASGTYSAQDKTGGSCGATMRFSPESDWGANAGLKIARDFLEQFKTADISYADLWTLAGVVAVESAGGPSIKWRPGRKDSDKPTTVPDGRLPAASKGTPTDTAAHVRAIFYRMGFNDREIVALLGAHVLGRCHTDASGFWGPWTRAETSFSNEYFRVLLEEKWTLKTTHEGKPWTGPEQFESADGSIMMTPADIVLIQDAKFRSVCEEYLKDEKKFYADFAAVFGKLLELGVKF